MDAIETERFILRPFFSDDGPALHAIVGEDPEMTWETTAWPYERTIEFLDIRLRHFSKYGFGVWAVIEKKSNELIGQAGIQHMEGEDDIVELVVYTAKSRWRQGVGYEACSAALRYGFEILNLSKIAAVTRVHNVASQKLMEKLGFKFIRNNTAYGFDVNYFELDGGDFLITPSYFRIYDYPEPEKK